VIKESHHHSPIAETTRDAFGLILNGFNFEVSGQEHLDFLRDRAKNNAIFAFFPHTGHLDSIAVRAAVPKDLRSTLMYPAAADYWYDGKVSSLFVQNFPINRGRSGQSSILEGLDQAEMYLDGGYSLVVSPEGTRSNLPLEERILHTGVAELALKTGKPIIPVKLYGLEGVMPKGKIVPEFKRNGEKRDVRVCFKKALSIDWSNVPLSHSLARKQITRLLNNIFLEP